MVDRCLELLKDHGNRKPPPSSRPPPDNSYDVLKRNLVQARAPSRKAAIGLRPFFQEVVALRESGLEGLPPPPILIIGKPEPTGANQKDLAATLVATSLGLPNRDIKSWSPQSPSLESVTAPEAEIISEAPITPVTQSPSTSIATLSELTIADTTDDESPIGPATAGVSENELPTDPTAPAPHETFYLEDGNVEVVCGNTLFRVHTSILSFRSPTLRQVFSQSSLPTAESPNGCPRILSSDAAKDFATLLEMIYLPGFVALPASIDRSTDHPPTCRSPEREKAPDFATFSSLLRVTTKYGMPDVRSQLLQVVRDAYPETFEGLGSSKPLGESIFSGPTPHPNEVLNLFVQQNLTSALPMAYYMATRRGPKSLMSSHTAGNELYTR